MTAQTIEMLQHVGNVRVTLEGANEDVSSVLAAVLDALPQPRRKGVARRRARKRHVTLWPDRVRDLRRRALAGESVDALAKEFDVHVMTVKNIRNGVTRRDVP